MAIKEVTVICKNNAALSFLANINDSKNSTLILKEEEEILTDTIYYIICEFYQKSLIYSLVSRCYPYYTKSEIDEIYNLAVSENNSYLSLTSNNIIKSQLNDYFKDNNVINIEGFICFRLYGYISILVDIISNSIEEFIIEKEYEEFIKLIRSYVRLQNCIYNSVEVVLKNDGFLIYDEFNNDITSECIKHCFNKDFQIILTPNDLLLSIMVTIAPNKIIVYNQDNNNKDLLQTLNKIFENKIIIKYEQKL